MKGNPKISLADLSVGDTREAMVVDGLSRVQIVQYAGACGDFNSVHVDERFAVEEAGYPSVFAHGMLSMGLSAKLLTDWLGDGVLRSYGVRFVAPVWPGDTLTALGSVTSIAFESDPGLVEIALTTSNQHGITVLEGRACAVLPQSRAAVPR